MHQPFRRQHLRRTLRAGRPRIGGDIHILERLVALDWQPQAFSEASRQLLERNCLSVDQIDCFIAHQANIRIVDAARERLGLPDAKVVKNIHRYGNTTAATIPLAMGTALDEKKLKAGDLVLLASVGAGFTVGSALMRWSGVEWS